MQNKLTLVGCLCLNLIEFYPVIILVIISQINPNLTPHPTPKKLKKDELERNRAIRSGSLQRAEIPITKAEQHSFVVLWQTKEQPVFPQVVKTMVHEKKEHNNIQQC